MKMYIDVVMCKNEYYHINNVDTFVKGEEYFTIYSGVDTTHEVIHRFGMSDVKSILIIKENINV